MDMLIGFGQVAGTGATLAIVIWLLHPRIEFSAALMASAGLIFTVISVSQMTALILRAPA